MTFADAPKGRNNNLSALRFVAALLVIFTHAFPLTGCGKDFLLRQNGELMAVGEIGLFGLFFYAGFLVMKSIERKNDARVYFRARCIRIFPALWITVLLCILVMGPLMTTLSLKDYFLNPGTWKYLINGLLVPVHDLPGVFESNAFLPTVNGSLWTLPVEFGCYVLCWVFWRLGFSDRKKSLICLLPVAVVGAAVFILSDGIQLVQSIVLPVAFFYLGMMAWIWRDLIPKKGWLLALCAAGAVVSMVWYGFPLLTVLTLPYVYLYLAFGTKPVFSRFGTKWELSYGIYLSAWPLQQVLNACFPAMGWAGNFALASVLSILAAFVITFLEKKATGLLEKTGGRG